MAEPARARPRVKESAMRALVWCSLALLLVRLYAANRVGFGDSEALYACYAMHPQPSYLDHPGLIGLLARTIGGGTAPTPAAAHQVTAIFATLVPWLVVLAARGAGASLRAASLAALVMAFVPEIAIGLFAMTPDLLLAVTWLGALAAACAALRSTAASSRAHLLFVVAGLLAGVAAASKVTGVTLIVALVVTYASKPARAHAKTTAPWAGLIAGAVVAFPIALHEARHGFPMLHHRFVDTQAGAGVSLRNAGAIVLGQLAYVSPVVLVLAFIAARDLVRDFNTQRRMPADDATSGDGAVTSLLFFAFAIPLAVLIPLCLWSRVAEPHWLAPPLLALPIAAAARASRTVWSKKLVGAAMGTALAMVAIVHAWVLVPSLVRLAPESVDLRKDIASELHGWPQAITLVRRVALEAHVPGSERGDLVIVGPHWVVCAQVHAALRDEFPVGCATPTRDDFDDWYPRDAWSRAETILFVTDTRFGPPATNAFPSHVVTRQEKLEVLRGGRPARTFTIFVFERRAAT